MRTAIASTLASSFFVERYHARRNEVDKIFCPGVHLTNKRTRQIDRLHSDFVAAPSRGCPRRRSGTRDDRHFDQLAQRLRLVPLVELGGEISPHDQVKRTGVHKKFTHRIDRVRRPLAANLRGPRPPRAGKSSKAAWAIARRSVRGVHAGLFLEVRITGDGHHDAHRTVQSSRQPRERRCDRGAADQRSHRRDRGDERPLGGQPTRLATLRRYSSSPYH